MTPEVARYFRGELREARAQVLLDSEAFEAIVFVLERLGRVLKPEGKGLGHFGGVFCRLAELSPLAFELPEAFPDYHLSFARILDLVREGRNAAVHEGALARHVTNHAVEIALILEDALMPIESRVGEFMVRGPLTAAPWQPLSFVRQALLANSFSYLPVKLEDATDTPWRLVSDASIAKYLRAAGSGQDREQRLRTLLRDAIKSKLLHIDTPRCVRPEHEVADVLANLTSLPILVVANQPEELLGIVTAFDLL